jgi:nitrite reductase (NADH) small subunit
MAGSRLVTVARVDEVPPGSALIVRAGEMELGLFNVEGRFHATQNECLHLKGPLGDGHLEGPVVTCPWHGWQYDITSGENEFDRALQLETFEVVVEDGDVKVVL